MIIKGFPAYSKKKVKSYLPPEGYFESREALFMHGLNQEATNYNSEVNTREKRLLNHFYACDRTPNTLDRRQITLS